MSPEAILDGSLVVLRTTLPVNYKLNQEACLAAVRSLQKDGVSDARVQQQFVELVVGTPARFLEQTDSKDAIRSSSPSRAGSVNNSSMSLPDRPEPARLSLGDLRIVNETPFRDSPERRGVSNKSKRSDGGWLRRLWRKLTNQG
jgi:hypothetical protein